VATYCGVVLSSCRSSGRKSGSTITVFKNYTNSRRSRGRLVLTVPRGTWLAVEAKVRIQAGTRVASRWQAGAEASNWTLKGQRRGK
jgi:hypothetical protein